MVRQILMKLKIASPTDNTYMREKAKLNCLTEQHFSKYRGISSVRYREREKWCHATEVYHQ
jgi:hypothetical protein